MYVSTCYEVSRSRSVNVRFRVSPSSTAPDFIYAKATVPVSRGGVRGHSITVGTRLKPKLSILSAGYSPTNPPTTQTQ